MTYDPSVGKSPEPLPDSRPQVRTPEQAFEILKHCFINDAGYKLVEEVWLLALDSQSRLHGFPLMVSRGDCDGCDMPVRSCLRLTLGQPLATSFMVAHNHPSGTLEVSPQDREVTRRLATAARACDLPLVDHLIIANGCWVSLRRDHTMLFH